MGIQRVILCALVFGLTGTSPAFAESVPDPEGEWVGVVSTPDILYNLEITLEKEDGEWTGEMQRPWPMPLESVQLDDSGMEVVLHIQGRIEGDWESGGLEGGFQMGGIEEPVRLVPRDSEEGKGKLEEAAEIRAEHRPESLEKVREGAGQETLDGEAVAELVTAADEAGSSGLALYHEGELVGEWYAGGDPEPVESMSVTKPILALGVGALIQEGRIENLDTPVHAFYPEWEEGDHAKVTLRHLLNHTSGLDRAMDTHSMNKAEDRADFALQSEIVTTPGEHSEYNNNAMNLLAGVIGKAADKPADEYLDARVFTPLGIEDFEWNRDEAGNPQGMAGLSIQAGDLARLGQLVLQDGKWNGEQLLDPEYLKKSVEIQAPDAPIGLAWFLEKDGDRLEAIHHNGDLGQYLLILPETDLVAARMVAGSKGYDLGTDALQEFNALVMEAFAEDAED